MHRCLQQDGRSAVWVMSRTSTQALRHISPLTGPYVGPYYEVAWSSGGTLLSDSVSGDSVHILPLRMQRSVEQVITQGPYDDHHPAHRGMVSILPSLRIDPGTGRCGAWARMGSHHAN